MGTLSVKLCYFLAVKAQEYSDFDYSLKVDFCSRQSPLNFNRSMQQFLKDI